MSREIDGLLARWRKAAREWETRPRGQTTARRLAGSWLDYQVAVGAVADDEIVLVADDHGNYVAASSSVQRYLEMDVDTLLGMNVVDLTPPRDRAGVATAWAAFLAAGAALGEYTLWRRDGQEVPAAFQASANTPAPGLHVSRLTPSALWTSRAELATAGANAAARASSAIIETRHLLRDLRGERPEVISTALVRRNPLEWEEIGPAPSEDLHQAG